MARRRLEKYAKSPKAEEAKALAKKVFELKEKLGISYEQMAEESSLPIKKLYYINSAWVNGSRDYEYMFVSMANSLIDFWNKHLVNGETEKTKTSKKTEVQTMVSPPEDVLAVLIAKVGLPKARKLLKDRGKEDKLEKFLKELTPEKLADLV